ncbi:unnamed protein product [Blepharisma stoltei]|uniref:Cyclin-dependent kinase inhibitor domain-containing protein n=1 Tax=Blepharisma stoltei TaxID=1481888 RepID=A0AAU9K0H7_9CILI|nr:unnamed protein product [Blepharisma stoltei]
MEDLIIEMKKELQEAAAAKSDLYNFDFLSDTPRHENKRFSWAIDQEKSIESERAIDKLKQRRHRLILIEDNFDLIKPLRLLETLKA